MLENYFVKIYFVVIYNKKKDYEYIFIVTIIIIYCLFIEFYLNVLDAKSKDFNVVCFH